MIGTTNMADHNSEYPLVSVVVPTHNRPEMLKDTLASILEQTYPNIEIIVISNGVNPANEEAAKSFESPTITYADQENSGDPSAPRNHGVRLSKGEYIALCDDDDTWMPEKIEKQIAALKTHHDHRLSYTKMIRFDATGAEWTDPEEEGQCDASSLRFKSTIPTSSVLFHRSLLDEIGDGFCEDKRVGPAGDYDFLLRCAHYTKFLFLDEYLIRYWSGDNRITHTPEKRGVFDRIKYMKFMIFIYSRCIEHCKVPFYKFIIPVIYQLYNGTKYALYSLYVKYLKTFKHKTA